MSIEITHPQVLENLVHFRESLFEMKKKGKRRVYTALLNRENGILRFAQKITVLETHFPGSGSLKSGPIDWKEIHIVAEDKGGLHFEILDGKDKPIHPNELGVVAWQVLSEMADVLNKKTKERSNREGLGEEAILRDLSNIQLRAKGARVEEMTGWMGTLGRFDAEKILETRPVGTYLLRAGDEMTLSLSFHASEENHTFVEPYLLTFVDPEEKISEVLMLHTAKGWAFFHDDPDLNQPFYHYFSTPQELVRSFSEHAKHPLQ